MRPQTLRSTLQGVEFNPRQGNRGRYSSRHDHSALGANSEKVLV